MKISKSKQELAHIIRENGGWRDGAESAAQCINGEISFWSNTARKDPGFDWYGHYLGKVYDIKFTGVKLTNWHQTLLSRDEYLHLYPVPDADGWIEWGGGECPVEVGALIDVKYRDLHVQLGSKVGDRSDVELYATTHWRHSGGAADIIAYRLHKPEQEKPDTAQVEEAKPTIEQLATDYRNKLDYANCKQDEADKANMESDAALAQLEDAIAEIGFAITPLAATEKEPELVINDWRDLRVGDEVECVNYDTEHRFGVVRSIDKRAAFQWVEVLHPNMDVSWPSNWRFIRRPT